MGTEEKKFKLDELPDQKGSEPDQIVHPTRKKSKPDPRLQSFKHLDQTQKADAVSQRWFFDRPVRRWGWVVALLVLIALEKSGHMDTFAQKRQEYKENGDQTEEFILEVFNLEFLLRHPILLSGLIPLFFKFGGVSKYFFEITFDGINAARKIEIDSDEPHRMSIKWGRYR